MGEYYIQGVKMGFTDKLKEMVENIDQNADKYDKNTKRRRPSG